MLNRSKKLCTATSARTGKPCAQYTRHGEDLCEGHSGRPKKLKPVIDRFMARVIIDEAGHWLFQGSHNGKGYVGFYNDLGVRYAHQYAYAYFVGLIPPGMFVLHKCDIRNCANPKCLFLGTNTDNMKDASAKGRLVKPEALRKKQRQSAPHGDDHWTRRMPEHVLRGDDHWTHRKKDA